MASDKYSLDDETVVLLGEVSFVQAEDEETEDAEGGLEIELTEVKPDE